jgi:hypothetical protein
VDWPRSLRVNGETFRYQREGYRVGDKAPAARYASTADSKLWYCEGLAYRV